MKILSLVLGKYSLWYTQPGDRNLWEEQGLPLGNGYNGMMHFGLVQEDVM